MRYGKIVFFIITVISIVTMSGVVYAQETDEMYQIGLLVIAGNEAFIEEMAGLGYVEGDDITYTISSPFDFSPEEYEAQIQAMVDAGFDVFVTNTDTDAVNLQALVGDTPIVFARSDDPIATGAVEDLVEPGGRLTGIVTNKPSERRLELLTEIDPTAKKVFYLYNPTILGAETLLEGMQDLAEELEVEIIPAPVADPESDLEVMQNIPEDADWVFFTPFVFLSQEASEELLAVSVSRKMGIGWIIGAPVPGYVLCYGPDMDATAIQAAHIVDRILRGAAPADLPVQIAENYLAINLEAAEAIDLDVPLSVLRQANIIARPGYFDEPEDSGSGD